MSERRAHIHAPSNLLDKATDKLTAFSGSWLFLLIHVLWFGLWIGFRIEPFPFGLLTMMVSLEAIFLSTLVMMSQNRQAAKDHKRDDLEAQEVDQLVRNGEETKQLQLEIKQLQIEIKQINLRQDETLELLKSQPPTPRKPRVQESQ